MAEINTRHRSYSTVETVFRLVGVGWHPVVYIGPVPTTLAVN